MTLSSTQAASSELPSDLAVLIANFDAAFSSPNDLPGKIAHLALALSFSNRGLTSEAQRHGRRSIELGLTKPEAAEGLLAATLSRGCGMLNMNGWLLQEAVPAEWPSYSIEGQSSADEILPYFERSFGDVPGWIAMLAKYAPEGLSAYHRLRSLTIADGAMPRKFKELILVVINAAERYDVGLQVHTRGALSAGASPAEVLAAVRLAVVSGGVVAWLFGADLADAEIKKLE